MTLEILGNIYITQGDLVKARDTFEKACPLIELIVPPAQSDFQAIQSSISPPLDQKHIDQMRHCLNQLKDVYTQLSSEESGSRYSSMKAFDNFKSIRSPYQRLRSEFELRKFIKDTIATVDFESDIFVEVKHRIIDDLQLFVQRYVDDFDGKIPTLIDIFERVLSDTPSDVADKSVGQFQDLIDECIDMIFKRAWDSSSRQSSMYYMQSDSSETSQLPQSPQDHTFSPAVTGSSFPPSRAPSLAAAPAPGVSSPSTLEPVIHGPDSTSDTTGDDFKHQDKVITEMMQCLQAGNRDCSKLPFPSATDFQHIMETVMTNKIPGSRIFSGQNGGLFEPDGTMKKSFMDLLQQAIPMDKTKLPPGVTDGLDAGQSKQSTQGRKLAKKRHKRTKGKSNEGVEGDRVSSDRDGNQSSVQTEESTTFYASEADQDITNDSGEGSTAEQAVLTRGVFSRKPTPVIPNATANAPPPALQMNLVFWQWVRMQPPQPTPLASVKVEPPSPAKAATGSQSSSSLSQAGRNDMRLNSDAAGVLFESSTTAGQNTAPRAAVSNVSANNTAVFALVFSVLALCLGVAYLNYSQQSSSSLRRKPKRTPKRTFAQHVEDTLQYCIQVSQEVAYPFLCYLAKQFVGLFVNAFTKLVDSFSRKPVPVSNNSSRESGQKSGGGKGGSAIVNSPSTGISNSPSVKKTGNITSNTTSSGSSLSSSNQRGKSISDLGSDSSSSAMPPSPVLTNILSSSSTSSNTSMGGTKSSKKKSPPSSSVSMSSMGLISGGEMGSEPKGTSKQVRFTKDTVSGTTVVPTPSEVPSDTNNINVISSSDGVRAKKVVPVVPVAVSVDTPTASKSSSKQSKSPITTSAISTPKKSTAAATLGNNTNSKSVPSVGKSSAASDVLKKNSPKSVVVPPVVNAVSTPVPSSTAVASKKKSKGAPTVPPRASVSASLPVNSKPPQVIPVTSSTQENAWKKVTGKSESLSPRSFNTQASVDSYDELLQHMKRTTVDSISIDEEEDRNKYDKSVSKVDKADKSRKKTAAGPQPKSGSKPFPYPAPIIIGSVPSKPMTASCDISPHSALRIAPGISSDMFTTNTTTTTTTVNSGTSSSCATSPSSSSPSSTPMAINLKLSPKVSVIPELDKAPSEIAPGLSASLLPPAALSSNDGNRITSLTENGHPYPRVLSDSLLVALNESSADSLSSVPVLGGLGLTSSSSRRLSETSAGSVGDLDDPDTNLDLYNSSPLFPLRSLDSLYAGGGIDIDSVSHESSTDRGNFSLLQKSRMLPPAAVESTKTSALETKSSSHDNDFCVQEFFSDLNKDSPVFCSANYPASTPPGMTSHGIVAPNSAGDNMGYRNFTTDGLAGSPPSESLSDFDFNGHTSLHNHECLDRGNGMGYGLFGNTKPFRSGDQFDDDRDDEEMFWKKNTRNSKMLLGSSLLDDDGDVGDDMFHFASQGHDHIGNNFFDDINGTFDDDLSHRPRWQNGGIGHVGHAESIGEGFGDSNRDAPPGFSIPHSHSGESSIHVDNFQHGMNSDSLIGGGRGDDRMFQQQLSNIATSGTLSGSLGGQLLHHDSHDMDIGDDNILTLSFTVRCAVDFRHPMQVASVRMASSLFGRWSLEQALPMRRADGDSDVFGINVEVPPYLPHFTFKYVITDIDGKMWMESGPPVVMNVSQRLQYEQHQHRRNHQSDMKLVLQQSDVLMSYVSVPPGLFLFGDSD